MTDWQPIDTAPRDGTKIDLWVRSYYPGYPDQEAGEYYRVVDCFWHDHGEGYDKGWTREIVEGDFAGHLELIDDDFNPGAIEATHWLRVDPPTIL